MNAKRVLGVLLLMAVFIAGCKPENYRGSAASNTLVPQQTLRLSEPMKVTLADPAISLERLGHITLVGSVVLATVTISNTNHWLSIALNNGQVEGFREALHAEPSWAMTTHYLPYPAPYYDDKTQHQLVKLFVFDLQQDQQFLVPTNNFSDPFPRLSGNTVVWGGYGEGGWNIYAYDITTQQTVTITHGAGNRSYPYIADGWVIYLDMGEDKILHAYNLSTQEALTLGTVPHPRGQEGKYHLVSSEKIVWADADTYRLHVYDLKTRTTEVLPETLTKCQPLYWLESMVGHTLLWAGCEGWALYDLDSKASVTIPVFPAEIQARMTQTPNEDATYSMGWIVMSDTRLAWTVIDGLGHSWLYTSQIER